jgi:hypothetical protein
MATFSTRFLGCKVSFADAQAIRERLLEDGHVEVEAEQTDAAGAELAAADVTVANISLEGVLALRPRSPLLVTSGYLVPDRPEPDGYAHTLRLAADGWAADVYRRETG